MPEVTPAARPFWDAFELLSGQRTRSSEGPNPISFADIAGFAQLTKITDPDEIEDLVSVVVHLDQMYLADAFKKRKTKQRTKS